MCQNQNGPCSLRLLLDAGEGSYWRLPIGSLRKRGPQLSNNQKPGTKKVYPEMCKELINTAAAPVYCWDDPLQTFIYPGFDCGSVGEPKLARKAFRRSSVLSQTHLPFQQQTWKSLVILENYSSLGKEGSMHQTMRVEGKVKFEAKASKHPMASKGKQRLVVPDGQGFVDVFPHIDGVGPGDVMQNVALQRGAKFQHSGKPRSNLDGRRQY